MIIDLHKVSEPTSDSHQAWNGYCYNNFEALMNILICRSKNDCAKGRVPMCTNLHLDDYVKNKQTCIRNFCGGPRIHCLYHLTSHLDV